MIGAPLFAYLAPVVAQLVTHRQPLCRLQTVELATVELELFNEIIDCRMLLDSRQDVTPKSPLELLTFIVSYGEDVFPNFRVTLQILLTIAVSIASCERSFSKLKLILSYLRASMGQDRLSDLALMSVEREALEKVDFDDVINQFASVKARKIKLI